MTTDGEKPNLSSVVDTLRAICRNFACGVMPTDDDFWWIIERLRAAEAVCDLAHSNGSIYEDEVDAWLEVRDAR